MSQFIEMFGNSPQKELGELATFVNGSAFKPEEWSQEGLPIVRIQNLTQGDAPYNYYSGDTSKKVCLNTGDILVSWSATLGVFTWSKGPALLNQHIFKVVFDKLDIEQSFFIYTVKLALEKMADKAHGSTMRHVVKKDFDSTKVSFPSMREQQRFVSIAEQADKSKFGDFKSQFIEMFGGLCQDTPWSDVVTITNGKAYPEEYREEGTYPICGSGGIMYYGEKKLCNGNTTILGRKGNINNPIFMESGYWIVDTAFSIDVDKTKLHPRFFHYWCCQYDFTKLNKQGVLPSLTRKDLEKVKMAIPQMKDQIKFVFLAEQADKSKSVIQKALVYLNDIQSDELGKIA